MSVFILGDIHGSFKAIENWLENYSSPGDTLIQAGDFGAGMVHDKAIESLSEKLSKKKLNLIAIRGNHDNPAYFTNTKVGDSIEFISDCVRDIEGKKYLFLGGAVSVDRYYRTINRNWWHGEEYQYNEDFLNSVSSVDYVVTHTCPGFAKPYATFKNIGFVEQFYQDDKLLEEDLRVESNMMSDTYLKLKPNNNIKTWYFGHFHTSSYIVYEKTTFRCLNIDEIVEVNEHIY